MKRKYILLLALCMLLCSCGKSTDTSSSTKTDTTTSATTTITSTETDTTSTAETTTTLTPTTTIVTSKENEESGDDSRIAEKPLTIVETDEKNVYMTADGQVKFELSVDEVVNDSNQYQYPYVITVTNSSSNELTFYCGSVGVYNYIPLTIETKPPINVDIGAGQSESIEDFVKLTEDSDMDNYGDKLSEVYVYFNDFYILDNTNSIKYTFEDNVFLIGTQF